MSNPGNVAGGHKANLNNPNTSDESKQHSREVLANELPKQTTSKDSSHVIGGPKAATHNPNVSDEGKASAEQKLAEMGASDGSSSKGKGDESSGGMTDAKKALLDEGKDPVRVEAGLKAAMANPNVTSEGKEHAKEKLDSLEG